MADFCFNGLTDRTPTDRAVTLAAEYGRYGYRRVTALPQVEAGG